jgi:hypothetical protein
MRRNSRVGFWLLSGARRLLLSVCGRGVTTKSDLGGVLMTNNVHLQVCFAGSVGHTLGELRESRAMGKGQVKFIVATDGDSFQAEDLSSGETVVCEYQKFPDLFGFLLSLEGISTVRQVREIKDQSDQSGHPSI